MSYILIKEHNEQHSHIEFNGQFQGKNVSWDTHFYSIKGYCSEENIHDTKMKQFIDIQQPDSNNSRLKLTIALNINKVNHQNIQKMMIMIKQYKNLSFGCHEYG